MPLQPCPLTACPQLADRRGTHKGHRAYPPNATRLKEKGIRSTIRTGVGRKSHCFHCPQLSDR